MLMDFHGIFEPRALLFRGEAWCETKFRHKRVTKKKSENMKIEEAKEISYEKERKEKPVKS